MFVSRQMSGQPKGFGELPEDTLVNRVKLSALLQDRDGIDEQRLRLLSLAV